MQLDNIKCGINNPSKVRQFQLEGFSPRLLMLGLSQIAKY